MLLPGPAMDTIEAREECIDPDQGKGAHSFQQAMYVHGPWLVENCLENVPYQNRWFLNIILRMPNKYMLLGRRAICYSMVTITQEQNIFFFRNKTHLDGTTLEQTLICSQLFASQVVGSRPIKREKNSLYNNVTYFLFGRHLAWVPRSRSCLSIWVLYIFFCLFYLQTIQISYVL